MARSTLGGSRIRTRVHYLTHAFSRSAPLSHFHHPSSLTSYHHHPFSPPDTAMEITKNENDGLTEAGVRTKTTKLVRTRAHPHSCSLAARVADNTADTHTHIHTQTGQEGDRHRNTCTRIQRRRTDGPDGPNDDGRGSEPKATTNRRERTKERNEQDTPTHTRTRTPDITITSKTGNKPNDTGRWTTPPTP